MATPTREATDAELARVYAERDALQQRLTAADERADALEGILRLIPRRATIYDAEIDAALKPAEDAACKACDGKRSVCIDWELGAWAECAECTKQ